MAEVASAYVSLIPSAKGFSKGVEKELSGNKIGKSAGSSAAKGFKGSFLPGIKSLVGVAAGAALGGGVLSFLKSSNDEAREAQKVGAQTTNVIKSTGGAAKVTAKHVGDLATAISKKSGIDDEAVQSGQNLLLTFTNVKNGVRKGNDIFDQATKAMVDMSAAMGKEPKSAAIQLGKALNDPVKGMTALSKVGVSFTATQKATNKALVEGGPANALMALGIVDSTKTFNDLIKAQGGDVKKTVDLLTKDLSPAQKKYFEHLNEGGHTAEAQKNILKELNKEFGGSAAAVATAGDKAKVAFGNLKEQVGTALLPVVDKLSTIFTTKIVPAISTFITQMQNGKGAGGKFVDAIGKIRDVIKDAAPKVKAVFSFLIDNKEAVATFAGILLSVAAGVKAWAAVQAILNIALAANPIGIIVVAIAALAAGLVYAYKHSETFRKIVQGAFKAVGDAGRWLWNNVLQPVFKFLVKGFATVMDFYGTMLDGLSHVPGFGWAKKAADAMHNGADKARELADGIKKIPAHKKVTIEYTELYKGKVGAKAIANIIDKQAGDRRLAGARAAGGPVASGRTYLVGERGPELFTASRSGSIIPNASIATTDARSAGSQEISGTLSLDRNGVATIHGVARDAVSAGRQQREASALHGAMGSESFR